jgi:hypothetical protein
VGASRRSPSEPVAWASLSGDLLRAWLNILCIANDNSRRGYLPCLEDVAFALRTSEDEAGALIEALAHRGLLDRDKDGWIRPHNWDGRQAREEKSTERVRRHRQKVRALKATPPPTPSLPMERAETGMEQNGTCFTRSNVTRSNETVERKWNANETPLEKIREEEIREREEESLSIDNDYPRGREEVVVDGGTFQIVSVEHRKTVEHARIVVSEAFAAVVADRGSSLEASLGGRWDCYRAAIDQLKACGKRIDKPAVYCRQMAMSYVTHGIPRAADVPLDPSPTNAPPVPPSKAEHKRRVYENAMNSIDLSKFREPGE